MTSSRPSDHFDAPTPKPGITQPTLGFVGYLRFFWRQLTSMRTALFLLLLLAFAAIPGSLMPQRSSDPNGVIQYKANSPDSFAVLDTLQAFDTYTSIWFSSIYLLLFISLIGCIIPRTKHHLAALRARPPKTPARLERLSSHLSAVTDAAPDDAVASARALLRKAGYRTEIYGTSVSAERGYMRETGNLVFHIALVGMLVSVGIGGGFGHSAQRVVVEGQKYVNVQGDFDSFSPGRFFAPDSLVPYRLTLDSFEAEYELKNAKAIGQAVDYTAFVTTTLQNGTEQKSTVKVNEPLRVGNTDVYLLGNGYAPVVTVRDATGTIVWQDATPFLPQDANLTSSGVIKIPDGLKKQVGMIGFFYPTAAKLPTGALTSGFPGTVNPVMTLRVYTGDLGLDDGVGRSVYQLDPTGLTPVAGGTASVPALQLSPGETVDLPDGLGTIELNEVKRFASFDVHNDPSQSWVLLFAILIFGGVLTGLFIPRRRIWVKATAAADGTTHLQYAGLARGEDPRLDEAVRVLATAHAQQLGIKVES
ncbi:MAG: cytochrome c biogenesis protein ResB [Microbacteriaceae bacterium]